MVATARAPESPENKVSVPFPYYGHVPPSAKIQLHYSLDGGPWLDADLKKQVVDFKLH